MITILTIGKKHEDWVSDGIERYEKRLKAPFKCEWVLLPHSGADGLRARQEESGRILKRIKASDVVVLLDERGENLSSPALSEYLSAKINTSRNIIFIIGGAYGVDESVLARADKIWSLSKLVFPHQLVRLILMEQIYRTQEIAVGGKYHHD